MLCLIDVYAYGYISGDFTIDSTALHKISSATVNRHVRCGHGGRVDLLLIGPDAEEQIISTSSRGIKLINPEDRAPRPWWVDTRKAHLARAKGQ
jgi:hypothetical protein